ncbi:serine hydroxymethyltransferase [Candidatus Woesearchaeota archaeon]|nr:serine hydroxymethyltransferase [Candidatus Woesearchaeota archaeon]
MKVDRNLQLKKFDPQIAELIKKETNRQREGLVMIPSENYASEAVLQAMGTSLSNKYSEGYPKKRYYSGNEFIDEIEQLCIDRSKELFEAEHANVQPHSGSSANMQVFMACLNPGDKVMGMDLSQGGHLTHGSPVNFSGQIYNFIPYGVDKETELIDMDVVRKIAIKEKPKMIVTGATAYPREFDFKAFAKIAQEIDAYLLADISHFVGLCLAGVHQKPFPHADVVTTTTHKTMRGPRSAIILCKKEDRYQKKYHKDSKFNLARRIDRAVFPGTQGGPLDHIIAAKAVMLKEAMQPEFLEYQKQIQKNAQVLADTLRETGIRLVSDGTDNHLLLLDLRPIKVTGSDASDALEEAYIYANKNSIPFDNASPFNPSGLRLGTPALTSRGMKEHEMVQIGSWISKIVKDPKNKSLIKKTRERVLELTKQFPVYETLDL